MSLTSDVLQSAALCSKMADPPNNSSDAAAKTDLTSHFHARCVLHFSATCYEQCWSQLAGRPRKACFRLLQACRSLPQSLFVLQETRGDGAGITAVRSQAGWSRGPWAQEGTSILLFKIGPKREAQDMLSGRVRASVAKEAYASLDDRDVWKQLKAGG